jgi:hypothetical protein
VASANVEAARAFYPTEHTDLVPVMAREDAVERLEEQFGELFDPDFETVDAAGVVKPDERGLEGFVAGFREWLGSFQAWSVKADDFIENGDKVLVPLDGTARSKTHQVEIPISGANLLTFAGGRITRIELHLDQSRAREAAGLAPEGR